MSPRAQIGYLTNYDSTNIYRIQILISNKVIRIKNIKFNDTLFYDPSDLVLSALRTIETKTVINILKIPDKSEEQEQKAQTQDQAQIEAKEKSDYDSDTIIVRRLSEKL